MENNKENFYIKGMTCASCELLIERKLKKVPGVLDAHSNFRSGFTVVKTDNKNPPSAGAIEAAIEEAGYSLTEKSLEALEGKSQKWLEIGACLLLIFALYKVLQGFGLFSLSGAVEGVTDFAGIFLIGLVAGTSSCLAVTGGLLLSMAAKYNEMNPEASRWQKFKPLLSFNGGRLLSYFFLGGLVGLLGQSLTLSPAVTGYLNIAVALLMFFLALSILKVIPKNHFVLRSPKWLTHWISGISEHSHPFAPMLLGALTFFLPCGFTQSLQLSALASGSFMEGALTMFVFALGTLPALLGISAISSYAKGRTSRIFLRFSGTLVLVLALFNLRSGLILSGVDVSALVLESEVEVTENVVTEEEGIQVIHLKASAYGYSPGSVSIEAGKPTRVEVESGSTLGGCATVITVPKFGLVEYLSPGTTTLLGPIENPQDDFLITCSMGMVSTKVKVISNL
ncbi:MAG: sulfite exporter TauE/SafE family protein [Candidatus Gracilibacteria bacterium]